MVVGIVRPRPTLTNEFVPRQSFQATRWSQARQPRAKRNCFIGGNSLNFLTRARVLTMLVACVLHIGAPSRNLGEPGSCTDSNEISV